MRILNLRPFGSGSILARFDVEITPDVKLLHWVLRRTADSDLRVYPPSVRHIGGDGTAAALSPDLFARIRAEAIATFNGRAIAHEATEAA